MTKKILGVLLSVVIFVMSFSIMTVFADENIIEVGDEVRLIYTIADINNVAGVSVESFYNSEYLTAENILCYVGGSETNIAEPGVVKWNFLIYDGKDFNNEDVTVVIFKALKTCTVKDLGFEYNCRELFNPALQNISDDPNSLFSVRVMHNNAEYSLSELDSEDNSDFDDNNIDLNIQDENIIRNSDIDIDTDTANSIISNTDISSNTDNTKTTNITLDNKIIQINNYTDTDKPGKSNSITDTDKPKQTNSATDTDKTKKSNNTTDTDKNTKNPADKSNGTASSNSDNNINSRISHSPITGDTAVDTSGSQNSTVLLLLLLLTLLGTAVMVMNKVNN